MKTKTQEVLAGALVVIGLVALVFLALRVSGLTGALNHEDSYELSAHFQNIGSLSKNAKVTISGVTIGKVTSIGIDDKFLNAKVTMQIDGSMQQISDDSYASILTAGLLGEQYIGIEPGANDTYLKDGDEIELTQSALVLEDLISKFVFNKATEPTEPASENLAADPEEPADSQDEFTEDSFAF